MPFILDAATTTSSFCSDSSGSTNSPRSMPSAFNLFRRKSSHSSRFSRSSSKMSKSSSPTDSYKPVLGNFSSPPTRRPGNPPTVANPFAGSSMGSDAPPAYSGNPPIYQAPAPEVAPDTDSRYDFLTTFDTIFLIDDSGSMAGRSWRETSAALSSIAKICTTHDKDGIDIYFLNAKDNASYKNIKDAAQVNQVFESVKPGGGTPTGTKLNKILKPYLAECESKGIGNVDNVKPLNIIVITDGVATDDPESVILQAATKLDKLEAPPWQIGIQFFQVGEERGAAEALQELDDCIKDMVVGGCRDIVDTVPWKGSNSTGLNADGILKVVLGSVNKRLDRKKVSLDGRPTLGPMPGHF